MRLLAIDVGSKTIGIAVSDALGISVRAVATIRRKSLKDDLAKLKFFAEDLDVEGIVAGLPLRLDGTVGEAAETILRFLERLRLQVEVPVFTQDERLTSYEAEQMMREQGFSRAQRRAKSDEVAAVLILQDYLSTAGNKR